MPESSGGKSVPRKEHLWGLKWEILKVRRSSARKKEPRMEYL